jgi:hypothetical protein
MRSIWCLITVCGILTACGIGDHSAGIPFPGNPPSNKCTTGTIVALEDPLPGSTSVPTQTRQIIIASSVAIRNANAALVIVPAHGSLNPNLGPRRLFGPVPSPTISPLPTPFSNPIFYAAKGFRLKPNRVYDVAVSILGSSCNYSVIGGARFKTAPY